jgi:vacuolar-type H+-ATPase subunit H
VDTPTYNADGYQTWKPQPGEYYKLGLKQRESYGGIIAALNDVKASGACGITKAYPHNFAGIIAAIEDLADCISSDNGIDIGPYPPGWEIIINPDGSIDGNWIIIPKDGNLWFDTRQGRLFVSIDGQYWQTNGGDGLAYVGDSVPQQQPVIGSTWYDTYNNILYVWTDAGVWEAVKGAEDVAQTTATLPLAFKQRLTAGGGGGANILPDDFPTADNFPSVLPPLDLADQNVQADYNEWLLWALLRVGEATDYNTINFGPEPPPADQVLPGSLWYDTNALELSVWYSDGDSSQWVPTSVSYQYDEALARMQLEIDTEVEQRTAAVQQTENRLLTDIYSIKASITSLDEELRQSIIDAINALVIPDPDLTPYSTNANVDEVKAALEQKVNDARTELELKLLEVETSLNAVDTDLINTIDTKVTQEQLTAVSNAIPSISHLPTNEVVDSKIAAITNSFLPRNGGVLNGRFVMQKDDISLPALDFSRQTFDSRNALMLKASNNSDKTVSFGTTEVDGEVAFTFDNKEDFCWIFNDTEKVFSIDRNGPAAPNLFLGDFGDNDLTGRTLHNKIDVRDRLETYQSAFEEMRQGISNSTNFDELKSNLLSVLASV